MPGHGGVLIYSRRPPPPKTSPQVADISPTKTEIANGQIFTLRYNHCRQPGWRSAEIRVTEVGQVEDMIRLPQSADGQAAMPAMTGPAGPASQDTLDMVVNTGQPNRAAWLDGPSYRLTALSRRGRTPA